LALLLLGVLTGIAGLVLFGRTRSGEAALQARYLERSGALERLRAAIYGSDAVARDYLGDPEAAGAGTLKARLVDLQEESRRALVGAEVSPDLRGEVTAWWRFLDLMVEMAERRRTASLDAYSRAHAAERRERLLHIADGISAALDADWRGHEAAITAMYSRSERILVVELVVVLLAGTAVVAATLRRMAKLEAEGRALGAQVVRAQEEERRAIARELHDEVGQSLTALRLDIGAARLERAAASVERIVEEVRRIALSLRPSMLDDLGLVAALEWQAREVSGRTGLTVEVEAEESAGQLPEAQRTCIYRVAQEALQNSVRHAGAARVRMAVQRNGSSVRLQVEDDGCGFEPARRRGLGLLGMEERVAQLGGHLRINSERGSGTRVIAELPL
jgi:signal transduction histidine kinase